MQCVASQNHCTEAKCSAIDSTNHYTEAKCNAIDSTNHCAEAKSTLRTKKKEHNLVRRLCFGYKIEANVSPYSHSMVEGGFDEMS